MDVWVSGLFTLASTVIGAILTYYFTKKSSEKARIIELEQRDKEHEHELKQLESKYKHELDVMQLKSKNEIEKLQAKYDAKATFSQQQATNNFAQELLSDAVNGNYGTLSGMAELAEVFGVDTGEAGGKIQQLASQKSKAQHARDLVKKHRVNKK